MSAQDSVDLVGRLSGEGIDVVRVTYPDMLGTDRAKDVLLEHLPSVVEHGLSFCRAVYHTTPRGETIQVPGGLDAGLPDITVHPDLSTVAAVPWEPGVAWVLGDVSSPESPREVLRSVLARAADHGMHPVVGPELEYFLCDPDPSSPRGWRRYTEVPGAIYTAGLRADPDNHLLRVLRSLRELGIGVTGGNHEYDGAQFEINLQHSEALSAADRAFRFKAAVKELARKEGRLATFMAKPFAEAGGSGFHFHLSCVDDTGNCFDDPAAPHGLSTMARHAIAGVLRHAPALAALANPTINSYKRFGPDTLAPWLIDWGLDNRSAMVRIPPERGEGSRLELRLGDASANPYLAIAATIAAALLGVLAGEEPPAPLEGYGYDTSKSPVLPSTLSTALDALEADIELTELLGKDFTTSFLAYKRDEVARFRRHVTEWEFTEYAYHL
ncbi:glutamine synthetase family protein [Kibdelosporangium phytohabitans]|uniref:Glutamine synthetase n=1 Tax=Kibdelosporangium phytohabitans TaxID=860235 RepID=A0A0N9IAK4_9PSEU|nr:glutamine synthetase family protein [Kibdelosporangium phytohabitans]ALG11510.1 glutamine synthetase [Kibdelosporangium phytohabitans]MBE1462864.1 glutamine synthetase [Kibdelosporangium phytohabitans]